MQSGSRHKALHSIASLITLWQTLNVVNGKVWLTMTVILDFNWLRNGRK